jgi:hypothetical protein
MGGSCRIGMAQAAKFSLHRVLLPHGYVKKTAAVDPFQPRW